MLIIKVAFKKKSDNFSEMIKSMFDKYASVELSLHNKTYKVSVKEGIIVGEASVYDDNWKIYQIIIPNTYVMNKAEKFIKKQVNKKFDYFGATFGKWFGLGFNDENKWYDAELIGKFLQYCLFDEIIDKNVSKMNLRELEEIIIKINENKKNNKIKLRPTSISNKKLIKD